MAALLVSLAVMAVLMSAAMPTWRHMMQREREAELIFRGEQYARAIGLFQRKFAGAFPPSVDVLVQQKFLRKKYADPMMPDGQFQVLYQTSAMQQQAIPGLSGGTSSSGLGSPPTPGSGVGTPGSSGFGTPGVQAGMTPGAQVGVSTSQLGGPGSAFGTAGARGGVTGVTSKSTKKSIRLYKGRGRYNEWQFVYTEVAQRLSPAQGGAAGQGGPQRPGSSTRPGSGPGGGFSRPGSMGPGGPGSGSQPFSPGRPFGTPPGGMQPMRPGVPPPQP